MERKLAKGDCIKMTEGQAREKYGSTFVVASLGALVKKINDDGSVVPRPLFDGSHHVPVNGSIKVRDQEAMPSAHDLRAVLRHFGETCPDMPVFGLALDIADAHTLVRIRPEDVRYLGCRARPGGTSTSRSAAPSG